MATPTDSGKSTESLFAEVLRAIKKVETSVDEKFPQMQRELRESEIRWTSAQ